MSLSIAKHGREFRNKKWMEVEKGHSFLMLSAAVTIESRRKLLKEKIISSCRLKL